MQNNDTPPAATPSIFAMRDFLTFLTCRSLASFSERMIMIAVGVQIYDLTDDPAALGWVGFCLFLPAAFLILPAGDLADRFDRRVLLGSAYALLSLGAGALLALTLYGVTDPKPYYGVLLAVSAAKAVTRPAGQSFLPFLVPRSFLPHAIAWNASTSQIITIGGPMAAGYIYLLGPAAVYATATAFYLAAALAFTTLRVGGYKPTGDELKTTALERFREGITYIIHRPIILGAISLDLFAVLLGGATILLPVYARDILQVGPDGLGYMRSAVAVGALLTALMLARKPLVGKAGRTMFATVALFGVATIVFGLSTNFILSLTALAAMGATDMVSMNIRSTMIQLATPDNMRGRVGAVNSLFIGTSNDLGDAESGLTADWWGVVPAVVVGGCGTIAVVGIWMWAFPDLRRVDRLNEVKPTEARAA